MLLDCGQLYLGVVEPLALLLHLHLGAPKTSLRAPLAPVRCGQPQSQLLVLALDDGKGLAGLRADVIREPHLVAGILHLLLGNENLLDGLRKDNKNTP